MLPLELGLVHRLFGAARSPAGRPLRALADADTVIVPASHEQDAGETAGRLGPGLADALARIRPGTRIASICTGAFVLAAAGLLDGRRATTHWMSADDLRRGFPAVSPPCGSTPASSAPRTAMSSPQRAPLLGPGATRPAGQPARAGRAGVDERTHLQPPFPRGDGAHPGAVAHLCQRVERARQLLEETDRSVDRVAVDAGFGTAASLRQHLQAALGVTPTAYHRTFRGPPGLPAGGKSEGKEGRPLLATLNL